MKPLALAVLFVVASAWAGDERTPASESREAEKSIDRWDSANEDSYVPPECIRAKALSLEGGWASGTEWNGSELRFSRRAGGNFSVAFATRWTGIDDVLEWKLNRTARLRGGAVVLNRAVVELGATYRRLWALEVGPYRTVAVVPTSELDHVRRAFAAGGCAFFNAAFECRTCFAQRRGAGKTP
jgi:hypothetical protein